MIVSASKCEFITNGTPAMSQITGTGCMLGMICATYLAVTAIPFTQLPSQQPENLAQQEKEQRKTAPDPEASRQSCSISFTIFYNL